MNIDVFAKKVSKLESGSIQVDVAQIKEILSIINSLTGGSLYAIIRLMGGK
jgi:hypothetical protein